jgi:hypothetical protein
MHTQKGESISTLACRAATGIIDFFKVEPLKKKAMLEDEYNPEEHDSKHETQKSKLLKRIQLHHIVKFMKL